MLQQTIIIYELNGEFWRDPYFAEWNNLGNHSHQMGDHHSGMIGYGFGWEHGTISNIKISGTVLVDATFFMNHYQLDVSGDTYPDYYLNFGPFWYEPESGIERPAGGEKISILGGLLDSSNNLPMIIVYEINGKIWRDSSSIGDHFGGGWFNAELSDSQTFHSPFDIHDKMTIRSGWNGGGSHGHMGGMNNFDSLFCQILEVYPQNIPNMQEMDNVLAGYEIHMFDPNGRSWMRNGGMMGGHMQFGSNVGYQMHYTDEQLKYYGADENSIHAKYWDDQSNSWIELIADLNTELNTVNFENNVVSNFVVLEFSKVTSINNRSDEITLDDFVLAQNYPNPFNPSTIINYTLPKNGYVALKVFDVLGREVATLVKQTQQAGSYKVSFNASDLPSGIYFYELNSNNFIQVKKMMLLK